MTVPTKLVTRFKTHLASAAEALGQSHDESLKGLYITLLSEYVETNQVLYSTMHALDKIGENIFG